MPAGRIGKEVATRFFEPPLTEVVKLVRFALLYEHEREPAAALAAATAGAGYRGGVRM